MVRIATLTEYLFFVKSCAKCLAGIIPFNSYNQSYEVGTPLAPWLSLMQVIGRSPSQNYALAMQP